MNTSAKNARLAATTEHDPRWAAVVARDAQGGRRASLLGQDHRRVLPAVLRGAPGAAGERPLPCDMRGRRAGGLPPVQALQARPAARWPSSRRRWSPSLPPHRGSGRAAESRHSWRPCGGLSPYHLHRVFKAITGLTPRAYAAAHRAKRVREHARQGRHGDRGHLRRRLQLQRPLLREVERGAGHDADGLSRRRRRTPRSASPSANARSARSWWPRASAASARSCSATIPTRWRATCRTASRGPTLIGGDAEFEQLVAQVVGFVEAPRLGLDLPLDVRGTAFQQRVWQALREIPAGATASYSEIAERIGAPKAVRAVAQACAANTLAVAIPCHRVVRNDGGLSGYRWGVERKRALLDREAVHERGRRARGDASTDADAASAHRRLDWARRRQRSRRAGLRGASSGCCRRRSATRWPRSTRTTSRFRSRVVMARHGFGRGEYKYFAYPLPDSIAGLRDGALSASRAESPTAGTRRWASTCAIRPSTPTSSSAAIAAGQRSPTPLLLQYGAGRLQLPAPGPLRRARLPAAGRHPAVRAGPGLHRRRVRDDRAAAAHAVAARGRAAAAGRRRGLRRPSPPGAGHARRLPRQPAARREPRALRAPPHGRHHLPRRRVNRDPMTLHLFDDPDAGITAGSLGPRRGRAARLRRIGRCALLVRLEDVVARAPFRHMVTPGGFRMSVAMTNCGRSAG